MAIVKKRGLGMVVITYDSVPIVKQFTERQKISIPVLADEKSAAIKAFGVLNEKGMASRFTYYIGKNGKVLFVDKAVKPASAATDIAAKLKELGVPEKK